MAAFAATAQAQTSSTTTDKSGYSTGRTQTPETVGEKQPQGNTGPINTGTGGAPPESPQGQSPPGMQAAPFCKRDQVTPLLLGSPTTIAVNS